MPILHDGSDYRPGQGREMALALRDTHLPPDALARYLMDYEANYLDSAYAEGFGADVVVADLIVRGIVADRVLALALLARGR